MSSPFAPSDYQQAVFDHIASDTPNHLIVEALAGSGKTTTLEHALRIPYEDESIAVLAFNKSIVTAMLARNLPDGILVKSFHSFGLAQLTRRIGRRAIPDRDYTFELAQRALEELRVTGSRSYMADARRAVVQLVSYAKNVLAPFGNELEFDRLADVAQISFPKLDMRSRNDPRDRDVRARCVQAACKIHGECKTRIQNPEAPINFDDMIWLPIVLDAPMPRFDRVFVDETQDLNACQLSMLTRMARGGGRTVAVGDRRQGIYSFRGADSRAIPRMIERLGADCLPLSICYRCPHNVLEQARKIVPAIEDAPNAPDGVFADGYDYDDLIELAGPGDFVLSRSNAPLISLAYRWLARGQRVVVRGKAFGKGLAKWVRDTRATNMRELGESIRLWETAECERLQAADRDYQHVIEKAGCLRALAAEHSTPAEVADAAAKLFDDRSYHEHEAIILSTTHRAKGLEAPRVWLLRDTYCSFPGPDEKNLLYVAITRAQQQLTYCYSGEE